MKKEKAYAAVLDTVYGHKQLRPEEATAFLLGNIEPGTARHEHILDLLGEAGVSDEMINVALPDLKIMLGMRGLLRSLNAGRDECFFMLRIIAELLDRPVEGMGMLNHVAAMVEEEFGRPDDVQCTVEW